MANGVPVRLTVRLPRRVRDTAVQEGECFADVVHRVPDKVFGEAFAVFDVMLKQGSEVTQIAIFEDELDFFSVQPAVLDLVEVSIGMSSSRGCGEGSVSIVRRGVVPGCQTTIIRTMKFR